MTGKIFISHAHKDKPVADKFVELLRLGCELTTNDIKYTSDSSTGIRTGQKNFIDDLLEGIRTSPVVIFLLSPNFYNSVFCVSELGATWGLDKEIYPILLPNFSMNTVQDTLQVTQKGYIDDKKCLDDLRDLILELYPQIRSRTGEWGFRRDQFLSELPSLIATLPKTDRVDRREYEELQQSYEAALAELKRKENERKFLSNTIEQLKSLKDAQQVQQLILSQSSDQEHFEDLFNEVVGAFSNLPQIVRKAIYEEQIGEIFFAEQDVYRGIRDREKADEALRSHYLSGYDGEPRYKVRQGNRKVKIALGKLSELDEFLKKFKSDSTFGQWFEDTYEVDIDECLTNEDFWKNYLYDKFEM